MKYALIAVVMMMSIPAHADTESYDAGYNSVYALPSIAYTDYQQGVNDSDDEEYAASIAQWHSGDDDQ